MKGKNAVALVVAITVVLALGFTFPAQGKEAYKYINWNKPKPMTERLLADEYILPKGWQKATKGVKELVFFNSGGLKHDIATAINMELFEKKTGGAPIGKCLHISQVPLRGHLQGPQCPYWLYSR
jgi:hypothetical protein